MELLKSKEEKLLQQIADFMLSITDSNKNISFSAILKKLNGNKGELERILIELEKYRTV